MHSSESVTTFIIRECLTGVEKQFEP